MRKITTGYRTVTAIERDGLNTRVVNIQLYVFKDGLNTHDAIVAACTDYCKTEEGRKTYEGNCCSFNWGDFEAYVPNDICKKYGFIKVDTDIQSEEVNFDEQLVDESDIFGDEE